MCKGRILVLDQEENNLCCLRTLLGKEGFQVVTTIDEVEALRLFDASPDDFSLVIIDLGIPRFGMRVCEERFDLHSKFRSREGEIIPHLFLSVSEKVVSEKGIDKGRLCMKPLTNFDQFVRVVERTSSIH